MDYIKGKPFITLHAHFGLRNLPVMDKVYQVLVNILVGKTVIHLELATEMLRPEVEAEVIREEDYLTAHELLHHHIRQVVANTNC